MRMSQLGSVVGTASIAGAVLVSAPGPAVAEAEIAVVTPGERSNGNLATTGALAGAGVVVSAFALYFHLDGKSLSDDVNADSFTGKIWTQERDDKFNDAGDNRTKAIVGYSVGGALVVSAVVYHILTAPPDETVVIKTRLTPIIAPQQGGAFLGGMWSF